MSLPDKCPTCGADTPAGDWKRWPVSPGVNLERELALARARIARLEDAGDALERDKQMLKKILADRGVVGSMGFGSTVKWAQAKEAKP